MAFLFGDLFKASPAPAAPQPAPAPAPTTTQLPAPSPAPEQTDNSPLGNFSNLWQNDPNAKPVANPLAQPLVKLDPTKLASAVGQMDFTKSVPQDLAAKALSGDTQALTNLLNSVVQTAFLQQTTLQAQMLESAIKQNNSNFESVLPDKLKRHQLSQIKSENPILEHPAVAPLLDATRAQISQLEPTLTASEVQAKAEEYFLNLTKALNTSVQEKESPAPAQQDYNSLFS